jgi:uncharacterized membrane protein
VRETDRLNKTTLLLFLVVISNTLGNTALSVGMKQTAGPLLAGLLNPWVLCGIALLTFWTVTRMTLLSWADLSYVVPLTSIGYVLNACIGRFFLGEQIGWERWLGTFLITGGTFLVARTRRA